MFVLALAGALAAFVNFNVIWNHFYDGVPQLFDTGWYAYLVHQNAPLLANPPTVAFNSINGSFYSTHYSPLLWLFSLPTYLLPVSPVVWLACLEALKHGGIAALSWCCIRAIPWQRGPLARKPGNAGATPALPIAALAAAVVLLAPFHGILLACIAYPHFETWFVPLALGFFWMLFRGKILPASLFFVAALLVREDVGFHLCGLLVVSSAAMCLARRQCDREIARWLGFAAAGFAASCSAVVLMKLLFPGDDAFTRVYLGDPPFAHLRWPRIAHILTVHFEQRGYIWMPVVVYALWAATSRAWWVLIGYAAFVPWFLFNFCAATINPATLSLYYAYPFAFALLWPLVGRLGFDGASRPARVLAWTAAAFAVSIAGYVAGDDNPWRALARSMAFPRSEARPALEAVTGDLAAARARGEVLSVDDAVAGLAPGSFDTRNLFGQSAPGVTLAGYFSNGRSRKIAWETTRSLPFHYEVPGTPVAIVSKELLSWPYLRLVSTEAGSVLPFLANPASRLAWTPSTEGADPRVVCDGPDHWYLWSGETWSATIMLSLTPLEAAAARDATLVCEVLAHGANDTRVVAKAEIPWPAARAEGHRDRIQISRTLGFIVPGTEGSDIAVRIHAPRGTAGQVKDVVLRPIKMRPRDADGNPLRDS
ncbi:MAG TPA: hypothetical protein VGD81_15180 [Opitutaceae bacterium]